MKFGATLFDIQSLQRLTSVTLVVLDWNGTVSEMYLTDIAVNRNFVLQQDDTTATRYQYTARLPAATRLRLRFALTLLI